MEFLNIYQSNFNCLAEPYQKMSLFKHTYCLKTNSHCYNNISLEFTADTQINRYFYGIPKS